MTNKLIQTNTDHRFGQAGYKILTLINKIQIELLIKDQSVRDFLRETRLSSSTFGKLKKEKPSYRTYAAIAEYFGLDVDELQKLPITRNEVLELAEEPGLVNSSDFGQYGVFDEAYFSGWFHGGYRDDFELEKLEVKEKMQENLKDLAQQRKEVLATSKDFTKGNLAASILLSSSALAYLNDDNSSTHETDVSGDELEQSFNEAEHEHYENHHHGD